MLKRRIAINQYYRLLRAMISSLIEPRFCAGFISCFPLYIKARLEHPRRSREFRFERDSLHSSWAAPLLRVIGAVKIIQFIVKSHSSVPKWHCANDGKQPRPGARGRETSSQKHGAAYPYQVVFEVEYPYGIEYLIRPKSSYFVRSESWRVALRAGMSCKKSLLFYLFITGFWAQVSIAQRFQRSFVAQVIASGASETQLPYWFTADQYGILDPDGSNGIIRLASI